MIEPGEFFDLKILRKTEFGLYLGDDAGAEVLLPNKYCPESFKTGEILHVFIHNDNDGRLIATTRTPAFELGECAYLKVKAVAEGVGAFMEWGVDKDLMVPFREQKVKMEAGESYIVFLDLDEETNRLFGSSKVSDYLQNEDLLVKEKDEVEVMIYKRTELGYSVIVNNLHEGLIYDSDIFSELKVGDKMKAWVKQVRDDHKLDIALQPIGFENFNDANAEKIIEALQLNNGFLKFNDKSDPEAIYSQFGISKKAFKKAVGSLYRLRRIELLQDGIKLL